MITAPTQRRSRRTGILSGRLVMAIALCGSTLVAIGGCAVASAMGTTASLLVGTVGLAADVTIGAARVTGKAIGAAAGAVTPGSDHDE